MIEQSPRRADRHVRPSLERARLLAYLLPARKHRHRQPVQVATQLAQLSRDLRAELSRRANHQALKLALAQIQPLQQRQRKSRGLKRRYYGTLSYKLESAAKPKTQRGRGRRSLKD